MKHQHYLSIFVAIAFCGSLFSQSTTSTDYQSLMIGQSEQVQELIKWGDALKIAGGNYVSTIEKIFNTEGIKLEGDNNRDTKRRKSQYEWMLNVAPIFVSIGDKKKESSEKIENIVAQFGDEFAISNEYRNIITEYLKAYSEAYSKYQVACSRIVEGMYDGKALPPSFLPPPPPPSQQHHRH